MAEIKWIKVSVDIFDNEKIKLIEAMPKGESMLLIWFKILILAGKQNENGSLLINNRVKFDLKTLAKLFNKPFKFIEKTFKIFEEFGMIYFENDAYTVTNWSKHQNIDELSRIKQKNRERVKKYRAKNNVTDIEKMEEKNVTCNVTETLHVTQCNAIDKEVDKEVDKDKDITTTSSTNQKDSLFGELFSNFENNIRRLTPLQIQTLGYLYDQFNQGGEGYNILNLAMKLTMDTADSPNFRYFESILRNWFDKKLMTMSRIEAELMSSRNKKGKTVQIKQEPIPEYMQNNKTTQKAEIKNSEEIERVRKLLEQRG